VDTFLVHGDIADWGHIQALVADAISQAGGIDVLVNCVADIARTRTPGATSPRNR
jgi:NAD(P)-dependent dehydrogenase (short-subunit alcohol dehydrogenase family)